MDIVKKHPLDYKYDEICKRILANKAVLARILKACVEEYKDCRLEDIENIYLNSTPRISGDMVHRSDGLSDVVGLNSEDSTIGEGTVFFDIVFSAKLPNSNEEIGLIINIEAQNSYRPGYSLIKRGIYYCSRLISSQYKRYFDNSDYNAVKKVYSIWICTEVPKGRRNTIVRYGLEKKDIVGKITEDPAEYDLLNLVMIHIGDEKDTNYRGILKFLYALIKEMDIRRKRDILVNEYGLKMNDKLNSEVNTMCNLSTGILERGIEQGKAEGRAEEKENMILNAYKGGMTIDSMKIFSGLTEDEIRSILKSNGYDI